MRSPEHLGNALLTQYLDGEISESQIASVRAHLAVCETCRAAEEELLELSGRLDRWFSSMPVGAADDGRENLAAALEAGVLPANAGYPHASRVLRRFGWGMALAASLALGILLAPHTEKTVTPDAPASARVQPASFDINGESFITLPYSNPDLPMNVPRIVEMQVPVASLAAAGIIFAPGASGSEDRTVLANVVLGIDGQPLGLHVLSAE